MNERTKNEIPVTEVPTELLQTLVDQIELNERMWEDVLNADKRTRKIAAEVSERARHQLEQATRDLISYLRYMHNIVPQGIPFTFGREIGLSTRSEPTGETE